MKNIKHLFLLFFCILLQTLTGSKAGSNKGRRIASTPQTEKERTTVKNHNRSTANKSVIEYVVERGRGRPCSNFFKVVGVHQKLFTIYFVFHNGQIYCTFMRQHTSLVFQTDDLSNGCRLSIFLPLQNDIIYCFSSRKGKVFFQ